MTFTIRLATAVICLTCLFFPDGAHGATEITDSNPADGSELAALPGSVEVWSSEALDPELTQIIVVAPNGARIDRGVLEVDAADPHHLSVDLLGAGPSGHYVVHLLSGEPNTARERSDSISFEVSGDTDCSVGEPDESVVCAAQLPEGVPGESLELPDGSKVTVNLSGSNAGPVDITISLTGPDGSSPDQARVWVRSAHLEMDHGEFPHEAVPQPDGSFLASYIGMGMAGQWRIAVDIILEPGQPPVTIAIPVDIQSPG